jgi:AraC-like DNA-binding protein
MDLDAPLRMSACRGERDSGGVWYSTLTPVRFPEHYHPGVELNVVLRGRAAVLVEGEAFELEPASMLWVGSGAKHQMVSASREFAMWIFTFTDAFADAVERRDGARYRPAQAGHHVLGTAGARIDMLSRIAARELKASTLNESREWLAAALRAAGARAEREAPEPTHVVVRRALALLSEPRAGLTLPAVASACRVSEGYLSRLFQSQVGVSPMQFRNHARIQAAVQAIWQGAHSMTELAKQVGFANYVSFHQAFRQVVGSSPREYHASRKGLPGLSCPWIWFPELGG